MNAPLLPRNEDPLLWWKEHASSYPLLSCLAKKLLCIPASSAPSERIFSTAGLTVKANRSRLHADLVADMIFLNKNTNTILRMKSTTNQDSTESAVSSINTSSNNNSSNSSTSNSSSSCSSSSGSSGSVNKKRIKQCCCGCDEFFPGTVHTCTVGGRKVNGFCLTIANPDVCDTCFYALTDDERQEYNVKYPKHFCK